MSKLLKIILITVISSNLIFSDTNIKIITQEEIKEIGHGWTVIKSKTGFTDSEFNKLKTTLKSPDGKIIKEINYSITEDKIIDFTLLENRIVISIYHVKVENPNKRDWSFEIIDYENNTIFNESYSYYSKFELFPRDLTILSTKLPTYPYFISVDECYIFFIDKSLNKIKRKEINFKNESNLYHFSAYPIGIKNNKKNISVEYSFTSIMSDDTANNQIISFSKE